MVGRRYWLVLMGLALLFTGAAVAVAQDAGEIPQVSVEVNAEGFAVPEEMPEGAVQVSFVNNTEAPVAPFISRLNEGVTIEDATAMIGEEDPTVFMSASTSLGGLLVLPGTTLDVTYVFEPGNYVASNIFGGTEVFPFTVADAEGEGAAAPEADLEISLIDFAFNVPISIPAGSYTLHLDNAGTQFHMMGLYRLADDMGIHEIHEQILQESEQLPEGVTELTTWFPMSEGQQAWITLDLEPGTYFILCPLPDVNGSGMPHHMLGMRQFFIVTEGA